jgi:hypothetical protein
MGGGLAGYRVLERGGTGGVEELFDGGKIVGPGGC